MLALGFGQLALSGLSAFQSGKAGKRANRLESQKLDILRKNNELARAKDVEAERIRNINNESRRGRQAASDNIFRQLVESSNDTTFRDSQLAEADSLTAGAGSVNRRSIRSTLGGGLDTSRKAASELAAERSRTQIRNQIFSSERQRSDALKRTLSSPVDLLTPGTPSELTSNLNLANGVGGAAASAGAEANAFGAAAGQFAKGGTQFLFDHFNPKRDQFDIFKDITNFMDQRKLRAGASNVVNTAGNSLFTPSGESTKPLFKIHDFAFDNVGTRALA